MSGIPGTKPRLAVPNRPGAVLEMNALASPEVGNLVLRDFAETLTSNRAFLALHEPGFGRFCRERLQPNKMRGSFHHHIEIHVCLVITQEL